MFTLSAKFSADVVCVCGQVPSVCAGSRPTCSQSVPQSAGVPALGTYILSAPLLCCRVVGGFDTLTAMENVESDPKTDRPKVRAPEQRALSLGSELGGWQAAGGLLTPTYPARRRSASTPPLCLWTPMKRLMLR